MRKFYSILKTNGTFIVKIYDILECIYSNEFNRIKYLKTHTTFYTFTSKKITRKKYVENQTTLPHNLSFFLYGKEEIQQGCIMYAKNYTGFLDILLLLNKNNEISDLLVEKILTKIK